MRLTNAITYKIVKKTKNKKTKIVPCKYILTYLTNITRSNHVIDRTFHGK